MLKTAAKMVETASEIAAIGLVNRPVRRL